MSIHILVLLLMTLSYGRTQQQPGGKDTKPLYLLTLVPFPDNSTGAGWDEGLTSYTGARIARDEINNRTDLLPGYHIELIVRNIEACSIVDSFDGLNTFLEYALDDQQPIAAVTGLLCSSHTAVVSPIIGHQGIDLIQLSAASSSIFETENHRFPHLWRFLGASTGYTDTILALMTRFEWSRFGIVFDIGSRFFTEIATDLQKQTIRSDKNVVFSVGVNKNILDKQLDSVIQHLKRDRVTVIISLLNEELTVELLTRTHTERLLFPKYTWISVEVTLKGLQAKHTEPIVKIINESANGHIHLHTLTELQNKSTILVSGDTYERFVKKFKKDFKIVKTEYNLKDEPIVTYASYLYDQVWAFALAVNNSLPILQTRNLSINNYTIGHKAVTAIIEDQLANMSFQGAGGHVKFNRHRGVSTPVEVNWIINGTEKFVGQFNPLNPNDSQVRIAKTDLPKDTLATELFVIPLPESMVLYLLAAAVITLITGQLTLLIYCKNHKAVKATDPYLSLPMFTGCYLLCFSSLGITTIGSFDIIPLAYTIIFNSAIFLAVNGLCLILITLFVKLLRIYQIFVLKERFKLTRYWRNGSLLLLVLVLTAIPNIILLLLIAIDTPRYESEIKTVTVDSVTIARKHIFPSLRENLFYLFFLGIYFILFQFMTVFIAIRTRKIEHKNFKDTKKVNFFTAFLSFTVALTTAITIILSLQGNGPGASAVTATSVLIIATASQLILFLPKLLPICTDKYFSKIGPAQRVKLTDSLSSLLFKRASI